MACLQCGNCNGSDLLYYCTAQNEFIIREQATSISRARESSRWKKGDPEYEVHRRRLRRDKENVG